MLITAPSGVVLVVEAATSAGSLALLERGDDGRLRVRRSRTVAMGSGRTDVLTPACMALLRESARTLSDVESVVCGAGPGSFTSLRIAGSFAKGLTYGLGVPLYAVPSLLLAVGDADTLPAPGAYAVALDALRGEWYVQEVRVSDGDSMDAVEPVTRTAAPAPSLRVVDVAGDIVPRAAAARWIRDWAAYGPVDLDGWEPAYGRLAEAQVKWEASHGRALDAR